MPQLSLYIDKETYRLIQKIARTERVSLSKWVRNKIQSDLNSDWPNLYFELFGSVADPSFKAPSNIKISKDSKREKL